MFNIVSKLGSVLIFNWRMTPFESKNQNLLLKAKFMISYDSMQTSVRTRRSNGSTNDSTFGGVLKCFSNGNNTKSIVKKISTEVAQLLLAQAFQVNFCGIYYNSS